MNYFDLYSSYSDPTIAAAWESQVKEVDKTSWLAEKLATRESELFARFAACYVDLRALPRGARRALQRQLARSSELAVIFPEYLQHRGRRLQHRMAWSLAGAALLVALGQGVVQAATITVTTNNPNIAPDGQCSLIEAIINANNDAATHPDCATGSGADTIVLPANANVMLSAAYGNIYGNPVGLPAITSRITIEGNGATIARQENAQGFSLIVVRGDQPHGMAPPGDLTLQNLTLSGASSFGGLLNAGSARIIDSVISGNRDFGVRTSGTLSIKNSIISDNIIGGGVLNTGTLVVEESIISNNTTIHSWSGLINWGSATIQNSTVSRNRGGGVYNSRTLEIVNSTIADNAGGIFNSAGDLAIINTSISGNTTDTGGGIFNGGGRLMVISSTISGNIANHDGGGLVNTFFCDYYYGSGCWGGNATLKIP